MLCSQRRTAREGDGSKGERVPVRLGGRSWQFGFAFSDWVVHSSSQPTLPETMLSAWGRIISSNGLARFSCTHENARMLKMASKVSGRSAG